MNIVALYLYAMNIVTFVMMGIDKNYANKKIQRIPEFRFFVMSALGGGLGVILGMATFMHKTQKPLFTKTIPYITVAETVIFALLFILIGV